MRAFCFWGDRASMAKAKVTATARPGRKKRATGSGRPVDLLQVRHKIVNMVGNRALEMVKASVEDAQRKGNTAAMRFLFEMVGLFPAPVETQEDKPGLAETLLDRLGLDHGEKE